MLPESNFFMPDRRTIFQIILTNNFILRGVFQGPTEAALLQ